MNKYINLIEKFKEELTKTEKIVHTSIFVPTCMVAKQWVWQKNDVCYITHDVH